MRIWGEICSVELWAKKSSKKNSKLFEANIFTEILKSLFFASHKMKSLGSLQAFSCRMALTLCWDSWVESSWSPWALQDLLLRKNRLLLSETISVQLRFSSVYRIKAIMNCNAIMNGSWYLACDTVNQIGDAEQSAETQGNLLCKAEIEVVILLVSLAVVSPLMHDEEWNS